MRKGRLYRGMLGITEGQEYCYRITSEVTNGINYVVLTVSGNLKNHKIEKRWCFVNLPIM